MRLTIVAGMTISVLCSGAHAAGELFDTAQVISSKPRIEREVETRQECDPAPAPKKETSIVAPIIGGVAGGLLGHQVGQGSGKTAATIIGATGGAVAGAVIADRANANAQSPQQCRNVETSRDVVKGYDVVYRYNGREASVVLPYNPGNTIKVAISAVIEERPAENSKRGNDGNRRRGRDGDGRRDRDGYDDRSPPPGNGGDNGNYQYRYQDR
jgi:uncharacterized protein YcfJ